MPQLFLIIWQGIVSNDEPKGTATVAWRKLDHELLDVPSIDMQDLLLLLLLFRTDQDIRMEGNNSDYAFGVEIGDMAVVSEPTLMGMGFKQNEGLHCRASWLRVPPCVVQRLFFHGRILLSA